MPIPPITSHAIVSCHLRVWPQRRQHGPRQLRLSGADVAGAQLEEWAVHLGGKRDVEVAYD
jgi:hypothetical protein